MENTQELRDLGIEIMNLGMTLRQSQLDGSDSRSGNEVLGLFLDKYFTPKPVLSIDEKRKFICEYFTLYELLPRDSIWDWLIKATQRCGTLVKDFDAQNEDFYMAHSEAYLIIFDALCDLDEEKLIVSIYDFINYYEITEKE